MTKIEEKKTFNVGDVLFVENGNTLNRIKLEELKIESFQTVEKVSKSLYRIDTRHKKTESNLFHITKLIPIKEVGDEEQEYIRDYLKRKFNHDPVGRCKKIQPVFL